MGERSNRERVLDVAKCITVAQLLSRDKLAVINRLVEFYACGMRNGSSVTRVYGSSIPAVEDSPDSSCRCLTGQACLFLCSAQVSPYCRNCSAVHRHSACSSAVMVGSSNTQSNINKTNTRRRNHDSQWETYIPCGCARCLCSSHDISDGHRRRYAQDIYGFVWGLADLEGPLSTKNYIIGFFEKWGGAPGRRSTISGTTRSLLGETRQRAF